MKRTTEGTERATAKAKNGKRACCSWRSKSDGTADQGCAAQWNPQALFEFGYSEYAGQSGTAYDLSLMQGSDPSIGLSVNPLGGGPSCPSKSCSPTNCPPGQGWTNPDQVDEGSPGDTVCYQGQQNFEVTWCA